MYNFEEIEMVHVEATGKCNASCPLCSRHDRLGNLYSTIQETHLPKNLFYKFFNESFVKQLKHVYFSGIYGDPCIHPDLIEFCSYLIQNSIKVNVDSNAGYRKPSFWKKLAELGVQVNFAVDGLKNTNHLYRRNVKWDIVESNMKAFSEAKGSAQWNFIVFEHNEKDIPEAKELAKSLGFDFRLKITQKFKHFKEWKVYENGIEKYTIRPPLNPLYRHPAIGNEEYSIIEKTTHDFSSNRFKHLNDVEIDCKSLNRKEIFLSYQGYVVPCCYLGTLYGTSPNISQFRTYDIEAFNLNVFSLNEVIQNLSIIKENWTKTIAEGKLLTCARTCAKNKEQITKFIKA